jgi:hydrogenase maturation protein HypF
MVENKGVYIHITGVVQGVGFRPFIYNLALEHKLKGWVKNTTSGVEIDVDGTQNQLDAFIFQIKSNPPPLASLDNIELVDHPANGFSHFEIIHSESIPSEYQPISADVTVCSDCVAELLDPTDRRYRYPFINCTNCGPRFTIIQDIPYDRSKTSMAAFEMCPDCVAEYSDPANRRFHAQPTACQNCGPKIWLEQYRNPNQGTTTSVVELGEQAIQSTRNLLNAGKIVAIKGLGGFHLGCNAKDYDAVVELRQRKMRVDKPFAVMMPDMETIIRHCHVNDVERSLLESSAHPIVLLRRRSSSMIVPEVAPGQKTVGVMLPYTPLHVLLLEKEKGFPEVLVMTSGNLSDEPICTDNIDARQRLANLADAFLMHDRDIHIRTDDSVMRVFDNKPYPIRRSRGYAPFPVQLPWKVPPLLAAGTELKNTFCITNGNYAFLSHHIGDLENYETLKSYEDGIKHFEQLFRVRPIGIACDLHPNYLATRYASDRAQRDQIPLFGIQHHHAHIASLMAEQGLDGSRKVIGVAFDGTGYGEDGAIWGGEFLIADYSGYARNFHLKYFPLPGGDVSIRRPLRTALSLLWSLGIDWSEINGLSADVNSAERNVMQNQLEKKVNSPLTSSIGRLFDAAAALAGVRKHINYEAQAAIEFESLADPQEKKRYNFEINAGEINPEKAIKSLISDINSRVPVTKISSKFHNGLAFMVTDVCRQIRNTSGLDEVALSGGVWQNITLLKKAITLLEAEGFKVYVHRRVPANDGGVSLGQVAIAANRLKG